MKQVASLRYEVVFKKAFSQPDIFSAFVKAFAGVELEIDQVETEKRFDPPIGQVDSRFDLYAEDTKNRVIVDIQHVRFPDHYDRFLYYHCAAMLQQIRSSHSYHPALKVFTIVVLTSGDRHKVDIATIDFDPADRHGKRLGEIPHKVLYLCPSYVSDDTPEPYREWLRAIADSMDEVVEESEYQNEQILKVFASIEKDLLTPQERARMKDEYGYQEIGRDQYQKGIDEGIEKGIEKGKVATAMAMIEKGFDPDTIAELTMLDPDTIAGLIVDRSSSSSR